MTGGRFTGTRRLLIPALLAVLHLGSAVGAEILHGRTEVISSTGALEGAHSSQCLVIHNEALCAVAPQHGARTPAHPVAADYPQITSVPFRHRSPPSPSSRVSLPNGVRGPPQA